MRGLSCPHGVDQSARAAIGAEYLRLGGGDRTQPVQDRHPAVEADERIRAVDLERVGKPLFGEPCQPGGVDPQRIVRVGGEQSRGKGVKARHPKPSERLSCSPVPGST